MITARRMLGALATVASLTLIAGCVSVDPLGARDSTGGDGPIVVGSQDYYSNEIVAEIYAQALESAGHEVRREFRIGQREAYLPEIEAGSIDLFPEYTGPVLQTWEPETAARTADDVYAALLDAAPAGVRVLDQSAASDQDSFVVTRAFAEEYGVSSIADLAAVPTTLTLGGGSEGENRPSGPAGIKQMYDVDVSFAPIEDGGGPLTVKALLEDQVQLAVIYTASPSMSTAELVALDDPAGLLLASHIVPLASDRLDEDAVAVVDRISNAMTAADLVALNTRSVQEEASAATVAAGWLAEHIEVLGG